MKKLMCMILIIALIGCKATEEFVITGITSITVTDSTNGEHVEITNEDVLKDIEDLISQSKFINKKKCSRSCRLYH